MKSLLKAAQASTLSLMMFALAQPAQAQVDRTLPARAEALVQDYVNSELFSGTVLIAKDGKPVLRKGFGAANREWSIPNNANTKFRIASMSKQFTAAAILRLVDEQKLGLDDTLKQHLPGLPAAWEQATIRQLLAHTSGIPSYMSVDNFLEQRMPVRHSPQQILDLVKDAPLHFAPGTKFSYSNTGYFLLGRVVEKASGMRFPDYLERKLLGPLRLNDSGYDDGRKILSQAAQDYTDGPNGAIKGALVDMSNVDAAGGMYSTVDDLLAWQRKLMNAEVLSPASTAAMFADGGFHNGMGWFVRERFSRKVIEHGGALMGFHSMLAHYPKEQLTIIVLSNYGEAVVEKLSKELAGLALGVPAPHKQVKVDPRVFERLTGRYQLAPGQELAIRRNGDRLFAQLSRQKQVELFPESPSRYFLKAVEAGVSFEAAASGRAPSLTLHQDGEDMKAQRID